MKKKHENKSGRLGEQNSSARRAFLQKGACAGAGVVLGGRLTAKTAHAAGGTDRDVFDMFRQRRSVRNFESTPVPDEYITQIIEAAHLAPTSGNQQPWKFLVIRDRNKLDELKEACIKNIVIKNEKKFLPRN